VNSTDWPWMAHIPFDLGQAPGLGTFANIKPKGSVK
jgi:hypothetical protein